MKGLADAGFKHISATTIDESRQISVQLLLAMMTAKAFSTLHLFDESEFNEGLEQMHSSLDGKLETKWHYEMTAYTATFPGGEL